MLYRSIFIAFLVRQSKWLNNDKYYIKDCPGNAGLFIDPIARKKSSVCMADNQPYHKKPAFSSSTRRAILAGSPTTTSESSESGSSPLVVESTSEISTEYAGTIESGSENSGNTDIATDESTSTLATMAAQPEMGLEDLQQNEAQSRQRRKQRRKRIATKEELSRREWLRLSSVMVSGIVIGGGVIQQNLPERTTIAFNKAIRPVNMTRIWQETSINVTVQGPPLTWVALDPTTFQKKQTLNLPGWLPSFLIPPSLVIRGTSNFELLTAATLAGSVVEMARTTILYPLLTLKVRIQSEINTRRRRRKKQRDLRFGTRFKLSLRTAKKFWEEGNLYAGLLPALLIAAPATGLFYGVRDVAKRSLIMMFPNGIGGSDLPIMLTAAFLGDVAALVFRTPFDTLSIRLQAASAVTTPEAVLVNDGDADGMRFGNSSIQENSTAALVAAAAADDQEALSQSQVGNWLKESVERLPAIIITDLPFLLSRIALNRLILSDRVGVGRYELVVIGSAILCALLTTPFDVVRTRILVDSSSWKTSTTNTSGIDGGSGEGVVRTFRNIYNEGDGGIRNLFAGWLERTAYLGIGRACLEPLQIIGYVALRDAILLEWFD